MKGILLTIIQANVNFSRNILGGGRILHCMVMDFKGCGRVSQGIIRSIIRKVVIFWRKLMGRGGVQGIVIQPQGLRQGCDVDHPCERDLLADGQWLWQGFAWHGQGVEANIFRAGSGRAS